MGLHGTYALVAPPGDTRLARRCSRLPTEMLEAGAIDAQRLRIIAPRIGGSPLRATLLTMIWLLPTCRALALDVPVCPYPTPLRVALHDVIGGAHVRPGT